MADCHAETAISLERDSELEESEILQCTPSSIVIQLYVLLLLMAPLNRPNKCSFFIFSRQKVSSLSIFTQRYRVWHGAHNVLLNFHII